MIIKTILRSKFNNMKKESKLLPCPFCGQKAYIGIENMATYWSIGCGDCQCDFPRQFKTKKKAIKFWNKRVNESKLKNIIIKTKSPESRWAALEMSNLNNIISEGIKPKSVFHQAEKSGKKFIMIFVPDSNIKY